MPELKVTRIPDYDERKGKQNLASKHGVDFQTAELVFEDPYAVTM